MADNPQARWLLLIHQIPPKPNYFRVKIWRRLQRAGAVAIKNAVYALPRSEEAQEDLEWILREIVEGGGDASLVEARFIEGLSDDQVEALFNAARDADYAQIADDARAVARSLPSARRALGPEARTALETDLSRIERRLSEVATLDFFSAPGRIAAASIVEGLAARLKTPAALDARAKKKPEVLRGRTWVTRKGIHIDRMASAWLIRRFIDPEARFKFVPPKGYVKGDGELRFDMFEAEYTHVGDHCTFEVLIERFGLADGALRAIAEIIHDVDIKDAKFERPETTGVEHLVSGIAIAHREDEARLGRASALFDDLYEFLRRRR